MDVVNDMDMDDGIGKNSRKLNPCNWLQNTKTLKMKNFLKIFKIGRKDDMNKLDLIKFFERTLSLLKNKKDGRTNFCNAFDGIFILLTLCG